MPPPFTSWSYMRRDALDEHGQYAFNLTGVEYGHDGIKNLRYNYQIPQLQWAVIADSGSFTSQYTYDISNSRVPLRLTCTATGTVKAYTRFQLNRDHGATVASSLGIVTYRNQAITSLSLSLESNGVADSIVSGSNIMPSVAATWEAFTFTPDTYQPSAWVTLTVAFVADTIGDYVQIGDMSWFYVTQRGNV